MIVQDCEGRKIEVGTLVKYGSEHNAKVTAISEPDIDDSDELHVKYGLHITVCFDDNTTDKLWAGIINGIQARYEDAEPIFEEAGDLEVIADA